VNQLNKSSYGIIRYPVNTYSKLNGELWDKIGIKYNMSGQEINIASLPFAPEDLTAGSESEMQTVVRGRRSDVDLPIFIEQSNYLSNILRRAQTGDAAAKKLTDLEEYLNTNQDGIWENSWVRFPVKRMGKNAKSMFLYDIAADKDNPLTGNRTDLNRFLYQHNGGEYIRVPVSYVLKLAMAEALEPLNLSNSPMARTASKMMDKFLNDNTSPETSSFYVIASKPGKNTGESLCTEMAVRYLLCQILLMYANQKFSLQENGQEALIFFSPHPPVRQKMLSNCISDSFYRELFMNPCLSGWDEGEKKHEYMHLCHQVLSRSQFNAVLKLREAGIINNNLVSLPNHSNISLANNGIHVSMGSRKLSTLLKEPSSGYTRCHEKYLGDLVIKIVEHFLPLFVGTYTAAPYRLGFTDFHPEKALGFLPHELDYTHLRMLWRRWHKKADLKVLGYPLTPFGPNRIDRSISAIFRLKGDFVPDFRLIDYLVSILSTEESPALNGRLNNSRQLKKDLADLGIFDTRMSLYLLEKLREYDQMGFSGFEGRHYSLFDSFTADMAQAVNLQNLIYLLAFKYIVTNKVSHENIPDNPFVESERRQVIFGSAIGIPTFFVHRKTANHFLKRILEKTQKKRSSRRYNGYIRICNIEYRRALLETLRHDAADLIEMLGLQETINDLQQRINEPDVFSALGKITGGILDQVNARKPMSVRHDIFNHAAEKYYRTGLRKKHMLESFDLLKRDIVLLEKTTGFPVYEARKLLRLISNHSTLNIFLNQAQNEMMRENASTENLEKIIYLILAYVHYKENYDANRRDINHEDILYAETSVH